MTAQRKLILIGLALMVGVGAIGASSVVLVRRVLGEHAAEETQVVASASVDRSVQVRALTELDEMRRVERLIVLMLGATVVAFVAGATLTVRAVNRRALARSGNELDSLASAFDRMAEALAADTERRQVVEAQLEREASHDHLTGLPNRRSLERLVSIALDHPSSHAGTVAVLFTDLDEFKTVNDELGHGAGDDLLRLVATRLAAELRPGDVLARFGGDEFVAVCRDLVVPTDAERVAARFQRALAESIHVDGQDVYVTLSVGIALNTDTSTAESMVRDADAAMNRAKAEGRRRHVTHDAAIAALAANRLADSTDLRRAVAHGDLVLEFQAVVDLVTGSTVSYEALVRWQRDGRLLQPASFVGRAEELGLARALDQWVIGDACRQLACWRDAHVPGALAVNVSTASLEDADLAAAILTELHDRRLSPTQLTLEITEGLLVAAPERVLTTLRVLRDRGVRVAIDDFGTGHSSLARLRDLPVDVLKMDRAFVHDLETDPSRRAIAAAMVDLGRTLGLEVVAEGVETAGQRDILLAIGCPLGQGFLFGRPRPASDLSRGLGRIA